MSALPTPLVYLRSNAVADRVAITGRLIAAGIAAASLAVLIIAAVLIPSPTGVGTHTALGMRQCQWLVTTGLPCPGCGMTTSFSWFARGNIEASLYVQPMGTVLAMLTAGTFWGALYVALTARPVYRLVQRVPSRYYLAYLPSLAIMAWAWKIWIRVHYVDGWH